MKVGFVTKSGFVLLKKVESLDEFWQVINTDKSIFARHKMYPTAFFFSWQMRLIKQWIDNGWIFQARKLGTPDKFKVIEFASKAATENIRKKTNEIMGWEDK